MDDHQLLVLTGKFFEKLAALARDNVKRRTTVAQIMSDADTQMLIESIKDRNRAVGDEGEEASTP